MKNAMMAAGLGCVVGMAAGGAGAQVVAESRRMVGSEAVAGDFFGSSVAIGSGVIAVGAMRDDDNGLNSGAVYLFDSATGAELMKIVPAQSAAVDQVGSSMAMDLGILAIGASSTDSRTGTVYLYDAASGALIREARPRSPRRYSSYGESIAMDGGVLAVGGTGDSANGLDAGEAYLLDVYSGVQLHSLLASDGKRGDVFGCAIDIDEGVVAVGAYGDDDMGLNTGSVYLFDAASGAELMEIHAWDGEEDDYFGRVVVMENGLLYVSASRDADNGANSGSVYVYDVKSGDQVMKILASDGEALDRFGRSMAIENGVLAVGCPRSDENGNDSGAVYLFDAATGGELARLAASDGEAGDLLGYAIAMHDGRVVSTALYDGGVGSVYALDPCAIDFNRDWAYTFEDVSVFLSGYLGGSLDVDLNGDGVLSFFDVAAFLAAYGAGCP